MVTASFFRLFCCLKTERDPSFTASLYRSATDSLRVIGPDAFSTELRAQLLDATKSQLAALADRRKANISRSSSESAEDREDLALLEEMEDFALEDMEKLFQLLGEKSLLVAVGSVRELGLNQWDSEGDCGSGG